MKRILLLSFVLTCVSAFVNAQDDLYFVPKKKVEKKTAVGTPAKVVVQDKTPTTVYAGAGTTVVVKDVKGEIRDVDEYNRRYTSRDNTFDMENDTLYINEKPYNERGEWINGFEGTYDDYEYAMRIIRFRNPRYAIPVSSPLYWDVIYSLPSWEWNVFDDGLYAYAFPTYSNRLWWNWRWNHSIGSSWMLGTIYSPFYSPWSYRWYDNYWYGAYGSYWGGYYPYHHHHHYYPMYAGIGGYWGNLHGVHGSTAHKPGIHAGRYRSGMNRNAVASNGDRLQVSTSSSRGNRNANMANGQTRRSNSTVNRGNTTQGVRKSSSGRVVRSNDNANSVRPRTNTGRNTDVDAYNKRESSNKRTSNSYVRSTESKGSSYNRPSSTRSSVTQKSTSYQKKNSNSSYRTNSSNGSSKENSTYRSNSNSRSSGSSYSSGNSSSRSSFGGSTSTRSSAGGGGSRGNRR